MRVTSIPPPESRYLVHLPAMGAGSARSGLLGVLVWGVLLAGLAGPASALAASPWWHFDAGARPSDLQAGSAGQIVVTASNLGDADANGGSGAGGDPINIADKLPAGLRATGVEGYVEEMKSGGGSERIPLTCSSAPLQCGYTGVLAPYRQLQMLIDVTVEPGAKSGEVNEATVSGGEAPSVSTSRGVQIGSGVPFGLESYEMGAEEQGGGGGGAGPDLQAGSHPFQLTTAFTFDQTGEPGKPPALAKDLRLELPVGLINNPTPFPRCTLTRFVTSSSGVDECPADTALGVASVTVDDPADFGPAPVTLTVPVFSLEPAVGEPARFGFDVENVPVLLDASVRVGTDYGITLSANDIPQTITLIGATLTFWGVPGDPRHDDSRGWSCVDDERYRAIDGSLPPCYPLGEAHPPPFLTLPVSCTALPEAVAEADSWKEPGVFGSYPSSVRWPGFAGCERLPSGGSIQVAPDNGEADTPAGFAVQWHVPQETSLNPEGLAESDLEDVTIALPSGMQLNPAIEADPQGCTPGEIGFTRVNAPTGADEFTSEAPSCPEASKIATVRIDTPLLPDPIEGFVYLAARQNGPGPFEKLENQPGFLAGMYLVAEDPIAGVLVKIPGTLTREPVSGQIVMGVEDMPQLPFEDTQIAFFGGAHAPFSTPAYCGLYTTTASFTPWSGDVASTASSSFEINTGPDGSGPAGCPAPKQSGGGSAGSGVASGSSAGAGGITGVASTTRPRVSGSTAGLVVSCAGSAGSSCTIELTLSVTETMKHGKPIGLSARTGARLKTSKRTIVVGRTTVTLTGGHSEMVQLTLNGAGRRLLAGHHRLSVELTATQHGSAIVAQRLVFRKALAHRH
jgi:hypothetical protein